MKLRQLQYVTEVVKNGMNVTAAAEKLFTSQPGVSSQIKRLEEELGVTIFERSGKHINGLTPEGEMLVQRFELILNEADNVKRIAEDFSHPDSGMLSIATTHTQARYVLPPVISEFRKRYPKVQLQINQGTPEQIASLTDSGQADIGIATEALELFDNLLMAADAEVIKTYVRNDLGIGICARMAYDKAQDQDLAVLDAGHLFDSSVTSLAIRKNAVLREYVYEFIQLFASHLNKGVVDQALKAHNDTTLQDKLYKEFVKEADTR